MSRPVLLLAGGVLALATLSACGGSDGSAADDSAAAAQPSGDAGQGAGQSGGANGSGGFGGQGFPGASGLVADVTGKTLQVQGQDGQTAVTYTDSTTFTQQVSATLADVTVGSCVSVSPMTDSSSSTDGSDSSAPVAAGSVRITAAAADGSCSGFAGGGGQRPSGAASGMPTDMPSGMPSDFPTDGSMPSGGPGGGGFGGFGANGQVSAVSDTGFTVTQGDQATDVTVSGDTTYTTTAEATADAVKVGVCVTAQGESDDTGAVTAQSIAVSEAVDGECTTGFGRGGFGGGQPGGSSQGAQ